MASPNISFDTIPSSIRKPGAYMEFNTRLAVRTLPSNKQRLLMIGHRLAAGTVAASLATKVFSDTEAGTYFGQGSVLHCMVRAAITANPYVEITAVAVDDAAGGVAATGSVVFAGGNAQGGSLILGVAGRTVEVALTAETPAQIATALAAAITAKPEWPVTASAAAGTLTIAAKNKGAVGNDLAIEITSKSAGFTATITQMSGGTGEPDITALLASLLPSSDEILVTPFAGTALPGSAIKPHVDTRSCVCQPQHAVLGDHAGHVAEPWPQHAGVAAWQCHPRP